MNGYNMHTPSERAPFLEDLLVRFAILLAALLNGGPLLRRFHSTLLLRAPLDHLLGARQCRDAEHEITGRRQRVPAAHLIVHV